MDLSGRNCHDGDGAFVIVLGSTSSIGIHIRECATGYRNILGDDGIKVRGIPTMMTSGLI